MMKLCLLLIVTLSVAVADCTSGKGEAQKDVTHRLRGEANTIKVAGCAMPLTLYVSPENKKVKKLSLGISVRTEIVGDTEEFVSTAASFVPGTETNITVPIVPCGETALGLIVRTINSSEVLILDKVTSNKNGEQKRSIRDPCQGNQYRINSFKSLIELANEEGK